MRTLNALTFAVVAYICTAPAFGQQPASTTNATPEQIRQLVQLLADSGVRAWLDTQRAVQSDPLAAAARQGLDLVRPPSAAP